MQPCHTCEAACSPARKVGVCNLHQHDSGLLLAHKDNALELARTACSFVSIQLAKESTSTSKCGIPCKAAWFSMQAQCIRTGKSQESRAQASASMLLFYLAAAM